MTQVMKSLLAGFALLAVAQPASAAPVAYTITGTVIDGQDLDRMFGGAEDLGGRTFTAVETFDPAMAAWSNSSASSSSAGAARGGFASVALTLGGATKRFSGLDSSLSSTAGSSFTSEIQNGADELGFFILSGQVKADYAAGNMIEGLTSRYAGHYTVRDASGSQVLWANFEVNGLGIVSAVPLPASAPLFGAGLLGLAAVGLGRRAKRKATA